MSSTGGVNTSVHLGNRGDENGTRTGGCGRQGSWETKGTGKMRLVPDRGQGQSSRTQPDHCMFPSFLTLQPRGAPISCPGGKPLRPWLLGNTMLTHKSAVTSPGTASGLPSRVKQLRTFQTQDTTLFTVRYLLATLGQHLLNRSLQHPLCQFCSFHSTRDPLRAFPYMASAQHLCLLLL